MLGAAPAAPADETAPELAIGGIEPIDGGQPGSNFGLPVTVTNEGTQASAKVWVTYAVTRGLDVAEVPSNCRTQQVRFYDEMPERWTAVSCRHLRQPCRLPGDGCRVEGARR